MLNIKHYMLISINLKKVNKKFQISDFRFQISAYVFLFFVFFLSSDSSTGFRKLLVFLSVLCALVVKKYAFRLRGYKNISNFPGPKGWKKGFDIVSFS